MYPDDLILVTTTSRKSARNICLCLNLYDQISGKIPNQNKSEVYFPSWYNRRVSARICYILNFKQGKMPFTYLGVLISLKHLAISHFNFMINRLNAAVVDWGKAKMSKAGKAVIINSILMATPTYYLSVYPILDSVLSRISQISTKFLWENYDKGNGMPMVNWNTITFCKLISFT